MKNLSRRDKLKIYGDLLRVFLDEGRNEKVMLSKVQAHANVPFDRLKKYISDLFTLGLIEDETSLKLTNKGKQYLKEYELVIDFMERMGLRYE
jgi:predicted transcriptional regulator